jgi:hypothetical protein
MRICCVAVMAGLIGAASSQAETAADVASVEQVVVTGRASDLIGAALSASEGRISAEDLSLRPLLRPGEIVEQIPGVIVTQHSGSGKANQYFLRGFNLDHGTDLAVSVDRTPVNLPSHAHGQGYADLNFLIPELVETVAYKKGPYFADVGDFGSAGAFDIHYAERLERGLARVEVGDDGYGRAVVADTLLVGGHALTGALEVEHDDGPWTKGYNERKLSGVVRYADGDARNGWAVTAMAYRNLWNATDQIPQRAIAGQADPVGAPPAPLADQISRWSRIDPSDGGRTSRYGLSADWRQEDGRRRLRASAYGVYYDLDLFSNFTYFLNDPVHGDQIEQHDQRYVFGGQVSEAFAHPLFGAPSSTAVGLQSRIDLIHNGLYQTEARSRLSAAAVNSVTETSLSPYIETETRWTPWLRTSAGLRADAVWFNVSDLKAGGAAHRDASLLTPKFKLALGPWARTELYLDYGQGFHSNDARGVTAAVHPATALARSTGAEIGLRTTFIPGLRSELSLWRLDLKSELVWDGDAGTNSPSGPTRRYGVEFANWWTPTRWLTVDADYAWSHARYSDHEPDGPFVPEALVDTFDGGLALHDLAGAWRNWSGGLRLRYFGPRPLTQDGGVQSKSTAVAYADVAYRVDQRLTVSLSVFNLFDAKTSDIDYYYVSRLRGEPPAGVADIHTHPSTPREIRMSLTASF